MCFQSEVFLHTTPVPLEEKIPKEVIHRWENAALDMYRRKTLYFAQAEEKEGGGPRLKLPSLSSKTVIQENAFGNIAKKDRIFIHYPDGSVLFFDVLNYNGAHNFDPNFLTIGFKGQGDDEFVVLENLVYLLSNRYTKGFSTIRFGYKGPKNIKGERNTILYLDLFFVLKGGIIFMVPFEMFRNHKGHLNTVDLQKKYRALMGQRRVIFAHSDEE